MKSKLLFLPDVFFVFLIVFSCEPTKLKDLNNQRFITTENKIAFSKVVDHKGFPSLQFLNNRDFNFRFSIFTDRGVEKVKNVNGFVIKE